MDSSKDESISNALTIGLNIKGSLLGRPDDNIGIAAGNIKMYENDNERFSFTINYLLTKILKLVDLFKI